jgi:hypothetical protein
MEEARLLAYDEGDNYVVYNVRTKKIERSRNVILAVGNRLGYDDPANHVHVLGSCL